MNVVLDWDGTVTEIDVLYEVVRVFGDERIYDRTEARLGRELTLNEVIAVEVETISTPLPVVVEWIRENARLRPGFPEFAAKYRPLVVSSGFHELIEPVLEREGLEVEVIANTLDPTPGGWRVRFRNDQPCVVCGEPCKRADVAGIDDLVYVGDGFSDRCVSLAAPRVFARDGLADYLAARGAAFEPFTDFVDLAARL